MPNESSLWNRWLMRLRLIGRVRLPQPPLIDRGFGLMYDTERDITWLQDANHAKTVGRSRDGQLTWSDTTRWVQSLNYRGIRGWRLPNARNPDGSGPAIGQECAGSELGHLLLEAIPANPNAVDFKNSTVPCIYWTGTEADADNAYALEVFVIRQGTLAKDPWHVEYPVPLVGPVLTWPVHDGDVGSEIRARILRRVLEWLGAFFRRTDA